MADKDFIHIAKGPREPPVSRISAISRGLALFLGGFTLLNLLLEMRAPGFDGNLWWIDLRWLPPGLARLALLLAAGVLLAYAFSPRFGRRRRRVTLGVLALLGSVTLANAFTYRALLANGSLHAGPGISFSLLMTAALLIIGYPVLKNAVAENDRRSRRVSIATILVSLLAFPLAQIYCFGKADYRRAADVIVVFGAGVYADGTPSLALSDRVLTACRLYHEGYAPLLVLSGGPGMGAVHETEAMRRMALNLGVPDDAIFLDPNGLDTRATVRNTVPLFRQRKIRRVLAVSQFFHLPRIKMTYLHAGYDVYTVPAVETRPLYKLPWLVTREVAALWGYYLFKAA